MLCDESNVFPWKNHWHEQRHTPFKVLNH